MIPNFLDLQEAKRTALDGAVCSQTEVVTRVLFLCTPSPLSSLSEPQVHGHLYLCGVYSLYLQSLRASVYTLH